MRNNDRLDTKNTINNIYIPDPFDIMMARRENSISNNFKPFVKEYENTKRRDKKESRSE